MSDYGTDIYCYDDADDLLSTVSGIEVFRQWCYRAVTTRRGTVPDAPERFLDIGEELQGVTDDMQLSLLQATISNEIESDEGERCLSCTTAITRDGEEYTVKIEVQSTLGPFALVLAADSAGEVILKDV